MKNRARKTALAAVGVGLALGLAGLTVAPAVAAPKMAATVSAAAHNDSGKLQWVRGVNAQITNSTSSDITVTYSSNYSNDSSGTVTLKSGATMKKNSEWSHGFRDPEVHGTITYSNGDVVYWQMINPAIGNTRIYVANYDFSDTSGRVMAVYQTKQIDVYDPDQRQSHTMHIGGHELLAARGGDDSANKNMSLTLLS